MTVTPHQRLSEEVLATAIIKFYESSNLIPLGVSVQALEGWSAKMAVGLCKAVSKFRKLFSEAPGGSKNKDVAELKARLLKANVTPPAPEDVQRGTSHEDLEQLSTAAPAAGPVVKVEEQEAKPPAVRPQATPARSDRLPAYVLESLQGAVLPPAPFATQGGEDVEEEVETEEKKPKAEKKKIRKDKKSKKSKKKKEIAGREEEENLAIPAVGPAMEEPPQKLSYEPGLYKETRLAFVRAQKELGKSRQEAEDAWLESEERADLLADLSFAEMKRRRFIK